jgi:hypothetical protein
VHYESQSDHSRRVETEPMPFDKAARNQAVFREVNERIAELTRLLNDTGFSLFICECSDPACAEALEMTADEYHAVRSDPCRFVVRNGHQISELERVVDGNGRFVIVEKYGRAAEVVLAVSQAGA